MLVSITPLLAAMALHAAAAPAHPAGAATPAANAPRNCVLVAPFENISDSVMASRAATGAAAETARAAGVSVLPISQLRSIFKDSWLELPEGVSPELAMQLAQVFDADRLVYGIVEGRAYGSPRSMSVTLRIVSPISRDLLYAATAKVEPLENERVEAAIVRVVRSALAGVFLGMKSAGNCFSDSRVDEIQALAMSSSPLLEPQPKLKAAACSPRSAEDEDSSGGLSAPVATPPGAVAGVPAGVAAAWNAAAQLSSPPPAPAPAAAAPLPAVTGPGAKAPASAGSAPAATAPTAAAAGLGAKSSNGIELASLVPGQPGSGRPSAGPVAPVPPGGASMVAPPPPPPAPSALVLPPVPAAGAKSPAAPAAMPPLPAPPSAQAANAPDAGISLEMLKTLNLPAPPTPAVAGAPAGAPSGAPDAGAGEGSADEPEALNPRQTKLARKLQGSGKVVLERVEFSERTPKLVIDLGLLDLAAVVKSLGGKKSVRIDAYVDKTRNEKGDKQLSLEMAQAAKRRLIKAGLPAASIKVEGFGGQRPLAPNLTASGKKLNRRLEVSIN